MAKKSKEPKAGFEVRTAVTKDPRFSSVHNDPRFNLPSRKQIKSNLDSRFKTAIAKDSEFRGEITVDKYGRKISKSSTKEELERYYNLEESETGGDSTSEIEVNAKAEAEESSSDSSIESEEEAATLTLDRARGERMSDLESSSDEDSSDEELEDEVEQENSTQADIATGEETSRFAVVNMDWDNLRAVDLMATFSSFVPPRNRIDSVRIYPSEYGKQKMAQEELEGPQKELFRDSNGKKNEGLDDEEINEKTIVKEDLGLEVDSSKLRKYQLQRLQYYYAVIQCDSVSTAKSIYDNCDGTEYESTANFFDLRYIPDDMTFDDVPHDECVKIPASYKPNSFVTSALQHSKVKLTWDETSSDRLQMSSKAFSQKEIDEMDFKAYLASDSEEEDDKDRSRDREKYRALLGNVADKLDGKAVEEDIDMDITFTPGLDDGTSKQDRKEEEETTVEKYRRKEKERRKKRMEKMKTAKADEKGNENSTSTKKDKRSDVNSKKAAELELLMMDDDLGKLQGKQGQDNIKQDKKRSKKGKKLREADAAEEGFELNDPRFQELFENPEFAIDTTLPQFKKTKAMEEVMQERRRRAYNDTGKDAPANDRKKKRKIEDRVANESLSSLVEKVKRRAKI
jgi:hypothetical protein